MTTDAKNGNSDGSTEVLSLVVIRGHLDIVQYLVKKGYNCPIRRAAEFGQLETLKYLVSIGCNPKSLDNYALRHSAKNNKKDVFKYLLSLDCYPINPYDSIFFAPTGVETYMCLLSVLTKKFLLDYFRTHKIFWARDDSNSNVKFFKITTSTKKITHKHNFLKYILNPRSMQIK
jgi:ankyrin repeat protein